MNPLLKVEEAFVCYKSGETRNHAVQGVSFSVFPKEILGVVGESGSGKSSLFQSLFRLNSNKKAQIRQKNCLFDNEEISLLSEKRFRKKVYQKLGWVPQDPFLSLHPRKRIKDQLIEALIYHQILPKKEALERVASLLEEMEVPLQKMEQYPHEMSGGIQQRILLAMALSTYPLLLIADEPTSSLDVILQKQLLLLFQKIYQKFSTTLILISHDIGFLAKICSQIFVMYGGKIVEKQPTSSLLKNPLHPYTKALIGASLSFQKKKLTPIPGSLPVSNVAFTYCPFVSRCPHAMHVCTQKIPPFFPYLEKGAACWKYHPDNPYETLSRSKESLSPVLF